MVEYVIHTEKFKFNDNRFEDGLKHLGFEIISVASEVAGIFTTEDRLIYRVTTLEKLNDSTIEKILAIVPNAVHEIE